MMTGIFSIDLCIYIIAAVFGMCIFSFLNVVIYRVPRNISYAKGFSMCPTCGHRLYPKDLVPVFSWLFLRGKCRYCGTKISPRYMVVEFLGAACAVGDLWVYGLSLAAVTVFLFLAILTVIAFVDADTMEIPNRFLITVIAAALLSLVTGPQVPVLERVIGFFCISAPLFLITLIIPDAFGGGDIKLMAPAGFMLGWKLTLIAFFISLITGGGWGIYLMAGKKESGKAHMPFGPFLALGMAVSVLFGNNLLRWYLGLFGL